MLRLSPNETRRARRESTGSIALKPSSRHSDSRSRRGRILRTCATLLLYLVPDLAADPGDQGLRADSDDAEVYVNDNFEVADAISRAQNLAQRGAWSDAAQQLQKAVEAAEGKLVRVEQGSYVGVRTRINQIIERWPDQGLEAFRLLYERDAQSQWEALRETTEHTAGSDLRSDLSELLSLFDRYFCTTTGGMLADAIGQRAMEAGDLILAEQVYQRVLDHHPDKRSLAPKYNPILAVVRAMRGEETAGDLLEPAATSIRWRGTDRPLDQVIKDVRNNFDTQPSAPPPGVWPVFTGDAKRNRQATNAVDEPGLLWRFDFFNPQQRSLDQNDSMAPGTSRDLSHQLTMNPVVDDDFIYVQRGRGIVALHRNTGVVAWQFRGSDPESNTLSFLDERTPGWDSVTLHDNRLYAALPGDPVPYYSYESSGNPAELVCLDAKTGVEIWRLEQNAIEEQFAEISFDASPLVYRDYLLVVGRRRRSFGFEDAYLYCFDANNGRLRYRTHLGSASTGSFGSRVITRTVVSMSNGMVYVCSNLGTLAALSLHTGEVHWLRTYERNEETLEEGSSPRSKNAKPWHLNPLLVYEDSLITLPRDGAEILVVSQMDGSIRQSISVDIVGEIRSLLVVRNNILCGTGESAACFDLQKKELVWEQPLPEGARPYGRGAWIDGAILVPTQHHLCVFDDSDGRRTDIAWEAEGEGGNLLALPDEIIVSGSDKVSVYVRRREIWKTLQDRMAAARDDPVPALELAEVALNGAEFDKAISILDEAMRRAIALDTPPDESLRRRIFDDVLLFVDRLEAKEKLDAPLLDRFFGYASNYPPSPQAHLRYRFHFARLYERHDGVPQAVRLYQQILKDRSLRDLAMSSEAPNADSAGDRAQSRIDGLIAEYGRLIYATYEKEAQRRLTQALQNKDENALVRVAQTYPNSDAAPQALVGHAGLLLEQRKAIPAAEKYAQAYHRYPRQVDRPGILRNIADAYESGGKPAMAFRWLTKALREHPSIRFDHKGQQVSFAQYRQRLDFVRAEVLPTPPVVELPLNDFFLQTFTGATRLLSPHFGDLPGNAWGRYFVDTPSGLIAYDAATGQEIWSVTLGDRKEADLLFANNIVAIFATKHQVFALDTKNGETRWSDAKHIPDEQDALDDWEDEDRIRTFAMHADRIIIARDRGGMTCRQIETGNILWSQIHRPSPAGRLRFNDQWIAYHVIQDGSPVICLLNATTGKWSGAIATNESRALEDLLLTLDSRVLVATSDSLSSYDPVSRKRRWRKALSGRLRRASLRLDVDAIYYSENGHRIIRVNVEDGRRIWESDGVIPRGDDDVRVLLQEGNVLVVSSSSVSAIDSVNGLTLWRGTTPDDSRFIKHALTGSHLVAVDVPKDPVERNSTAFFYDHRNASGVIARNGGAPDLGAIEDLRNVMLVDGALLIQTGPSIRAWRKE